jgi:hypothetical protein
MSATENLDDAIDDYSTDASTAFTMARSTILNAPASPNEEQAKALEAAQGELAGAFARLNTAARLHDEQVNRAGLAAAVKLMEATAETTEAICTKLLRLAQADPLTNNAPSDDDLDLINALTTALQALAQLSPAEIWTRDRQSQSA